MPAFLAAANFTVVSTPAAWSPPITPVWMAWYNRRCGVTCRFAWARSSRASSARDEQGHLRAEEVHAAEVRLVLVALEPADDRLAKVRPEALLVSNFNLGLSVHLALDLIVEATRAALT